MYSYIKGFVSIQESNYIVLENNGIGYQIYVANPFSFPLNEEVKVYIYSHIKEDEHSLYGFLNPEEKELFLKLLSVKGVGPKLIMPMLATGSVAGIIDAIDRENILYLKKFPKVGEKVARQIILDLKGKLASVSDTPAIGGFDELVSVLEGLGYKTNDIKKILPNMDASLPIESQVKEALKQLLK
ncbi:TPA: Holliday junction branch migration protein RuvA [Candidatus Ventrenecus avicola]|nr:Holliday junction branch migration protein RuvA [Candidatus Ventrenecus avicola]